MNYIYNFQKGIDTINFDYTEEEIISILGKPDRVEKTEYEKCMCNYYSMFYDSYEMDITIKIYYKPDPISDCYTDEVESKSMYIAMSEKFIFEGKNWFDLKKREILKIIRELYSRYQIEYQYDYEKSELIEFTMEQYIFDDLGIIVFFHDNKINQVFVQKPDNELILPEPKKKPKLKTYQLEPLETDLQMVSEPKTEYKAKKT